MTDRTAEKLANVVLGIAVAGAALYVLRTPSLRRIAVRVAMVTLTGTIPAWFKKEITESWHASAATTPEPGARADL